MFPPVRRLPAHHSARSSGRNDRGLAQPPGAIANDDVCASSNGLSIIFATTIQRARLARREAALSEAQRPFHPPITHAATVFRDRSDGSVRQEQPAAPHAESPLRHDDALLSKFFCRKRLRGRILFSRGSRRRGFF